MAVKKVSLLFLFSFGYMSSAAPTEALGKDLSMKERIQDYFKNFSPKRENLRASIEQYRSVVKEGLPEKKTQLVGTFWLKSKPGLLKFRWDLNSYETKSLEQQFVSNGNTIWTYNALSQHARKLRGDAPDSEFVHILKDFRTIKKSYTVGEWTSPLKSDSRSISLDWPAKEPQKTDLYVELTPKKPGALVKILAHIDVKTDTVNELRMLFQNDSRTRIVLNHYEFDTIDDKMFEFTPPKGVHIDN